MAPKASSITIPVLAVCILAFSACGNASDDAVPPPAAVFTHPDAERWELFATPRLEIGGSDEREGYALGNPRGAILIQDQLVIADAMFHEVRSYALSGELLFRSGRRGSGPGEYRSIQALAAYNDTILTVWDASLRRLTLLGLDGTVHATFTADLSGAESVAPIFVGVLTGGKFMFRDNPPTSMLRGQPMGERRDSIQYVVLESDGSWSGISWKEPGTEAFFRQTDNMWNDVPVIFGRSTLETVAGGDPIVASNDSLHLRRLAASGSLLRSANYPWTPTTVKQQWVEAERQRLLDEEIETVHRMLRLTSGGDPATQARVSADLEEQYEQLPYRRTLPAFADLRSDAHGNLWVAEYIGPQSEEKTSWAVLDSLFEPVATIAVPSSINILDLGAAYIVGATRDELGRMTVALYSIIKG